MANLHSFPRYKRIVLYDTLSKPEPDALSKVCQLIRFCRFAKLA